MSDPKPRPPIDWDAVTEDLIKYGHDVVDRVGERLTANVGFARKREYGADKLLDDVAAFWKAVADDIERGVVCYQKHVEHRDVGA